MKSIKLMAFAVLSMAACTKDVVREAPVKSLTAVFSQDDLTKTGYVGGEYMWKTNDNIVVRSNNTKGFTVFRYTGENTAGSATFTSAAEDAVVYGNNSYAYYPAVTSGSGDSYFPREEEGSLKLVLKENYTWADGNVEAPMLAKVEAGNPLVFKQLGGVLKLTLKNVPSKAAKVLITAPVTDPSLKASYKTYKICSVMKQTHNWTTDGGGFGSETPFLQAYAHANTYTITENIAAASAAQRVSDEGIVVYVPLPVGPVEQGGKHVYPRIEVRLATADGTAIPGAGRYVENVVMERAHMTPMREIVLPKYTSEVLAGVDGQKAADAEGKLNNVRGLVRQPDGNLILMESAGSGTRSLRFIDVSNGTFTTFRDNSKLGDPWHGTIEGNYLYFSDKSKGKVFSMDLTAQTRSVTEVKSGLSQAMDVKFDASGNAYVLLRDTGIYKYEGGFDGTQSVYAPLSAFGTGVTLLSMAFDPAGNLLVGTSATTAENTNGYKIYKVDTAGQVDCIAGTGEKATDFGSIVDGAALSAKFTSNLQGMTLDGSGNVYVTDNVAVRKITVTAPGVYEGAVVTTLLGGFYSLQDIVFSADYSTLYVSDASRGTVRKITIE